MNERLSKKVNKYLLIKQRRSSNWYLCNFTLHSSSTDTYMKYQMMESQSSLIALLMLSSQVGVFLYMASLIASDPIGY